MTPAPPATPSAVLASASEDTPPILHLPGSNLLLRLARPSDAPALAAAANNHAVWRNLRDTMPHPYTLADAHAYIALCVGEPSWQQATDWPALSGPTVPTRYVIVRGGRVVGSVGVKFREDVARRGVELGYWLAEEEWGRGVMTEVVRAFVGWVWETFEQVVRVDAGVFAWNKASARVLEKAGFELEGKLRKAVWKEGVLVDELVYGVLRPGLEG